MSKPEKWYGLVLNETARHVAVALLMIGLAPLAALISHSFRARFALYDPWLVVVLGATALTLAVADVYVLVPYKEHRIPLLSLLVCVALFLIMTLGARERTLESNLPVVITLLLLAVSRLTHLGWAHQQRSFSESRIGFATTGVIVNEANREEPQFILVLNENLRAGRGLWVPPGGHFIPHRENPVSKLLRKVRDEIGVDATVIDSCAHASVDRATLSTDSADWLTPPLFLLDENLMGRCSYGHEIHIDCVYLLKTDGIHRGGDHKYADGKIEIPVKACGTLEQTEAAIRGAISAWHARTRGERPGLVETLTKDVSWRLHLAADVYLRFAGADNS